LQSRRLDLQGRNSQLARKVLLTKFVLGNKPPPVPLWLLGYLSEACPPELVVTNLHIKQDADLWKVRLEGTVQTAATRSGSASFSNSVSLLNARLSDGPFHLQNVLTNDMEKEALTRKKESEFPDLRAKTTAPAASKPLAENQFLIEGVIR
jgi:hypothetical protein